MPYYLKLEPLSPLKSDVITLERLNTMMTLKIGGSGNLRQGEFWRSSVNDQEYKGFQVPARLQIGDLDHATGRKTSYHLIRIGDEIDLRGYDDAATSVDMTKEKPTLEQLKARFPPITDPEEIAHAERLFLSIYKRSIAHSPSLVSKEEKLKAIKPSGVSPEEVERFAILIGGDDPETLVFAAKLAAAAYHPWGFLQKTERIEGMSLNECRSFSWHSVLMHEHLADTNRIAIVDWKFGADEIGGVIARVSGHPFAFPGDTPSEEMGYDLLVRAQTLLMREGRALVMLGDEGDSIAFTIVPKRSLREVLRLGTELGLRPIGPEKKGLFQRIFS
ncbi:hypothetical protein [Cognatiyoonia sp. IB215182]|uniref:DUF6630 family protein n=1 Tax=Cognatiyoonia sp. IB215182 TaxID=3097353 RepID=UPI002A1187C4|nr:hypothetical protein [Cognatiyoonia sp. IB215182]MDX8353457.1 hypothetical protein [Cognatiyoonia sp. IB215182]